MVDQFFGIFQKVNICANKRVRESLIQSCENDALGACSSSQWSHSCYVIPANESCEDATPQNNERQYNSQSKIATYRGKISLFNNERPVEEHRPAYDDRRWCPCIEGHLEQHESFKVCQVGLTDNEKIRLSKKSVKNKTNSMYRKKNPVNPNLVNPNIVNPNIVNPNNVNQKRNNIRKK